MPGDRAFVEYGLHGHVALIQMKRPEKLNALSVKFMTDLADCWIRFRDDADAWVAVLTGSGRAFSAGMDIHERFDTGRPYLAKVPEWPYDPWFEEHLDKPTIAAVQGYAYGGGFFFASRCDLRIAADTALFQITEPLRGAIAGYEVLLLENLPYAIAAELATGKTISGQRAYEIGFVNAVVPEAELLDTAMARAQELCSMPPLALHYNLKLLRDIRRDRSRISHSMEIEIAEIWRILNSSDDTREAFTRVGDERPTTYQRR